MNVVVIDNKSYVVLPEESYQVLQKKAALKTWPEKILSRHGGVIPKRSG